MTMTIGDTDMTRPKAGHHAEPVEARAARKHDLRKKLIVSVHAAARKLGLDDDTRRDVYQRATDKRSLTEMTTTQIGKVLDALNVQARTPQQDYRTAWARKAKALWITAYWCAIIDDQSPRAMDAFITRQTGIARREWVTGDKAIPVIEALKSMLDRHGFSTGWSSGNNAALYYARTLFNKCASAGLVTHIYLEDYAQSALGIAPAATRGIKSSPYDYGQCNQMIEALGTLWRAHTKANG
jgi:Protein of unknown function (DUF1018)